MENIKLAKKTIRHLDLNHNKSPRANLIKEIQFYNGTTVSLKFLGGGGVISIQVIA